MLTYEERLDSDSRWAMGEGSRHFEGQSKVQESLDRIARRLTELGIPYAIVGAMAMFYHGHRRFTEDVDLLVTREGLKQIHKNLEGLGYVRTYSRGKNLRDAESGVRIEFIITGFPGDGKPKAVAFPNPDDVSIEIDNIRFLKIESLVELKLASGLSNAERAKDLTDVQELIKTLELPNLLADSLNPSVRDKYLELWMTVNGKPKRYVDIWRNKFLTADAKSLEEMVTSLTSAVERLKAMLADGVTLDPNSRTGDDYAYLVTTDREVAKKYGMPEESEFFDDSDDDESEEAGG